MILNDHFKEFIKKHALEVSPKECCGFILKNNETLRCNNYSDNPNSKFVIDPMVVQKYRSEIAAVYHSHYNDENFSKSDIYISEKLNIPYVLYNCLSNSYAEYSPKGIVIPFEGRPFLIGIFDCINLAKEFYLKKLNIQINGEIDHPARYNNKEWKKFLNDEQGKGLVEKLLIKNSFLEVSSPKNFDILLMSSPYINAPINLAIFKDSHILHYYENFSRFDFYGPFFKRYTYKIFRHELLK